MNIWECSEWESVYLNSNCRKGIKIDFDKEVDMDLRNAIKTMIAWLRTEYEFPIRVRIYIKKDLLVKATDGDMCPDFFFWPADRYDEPYIKLATGDYNELLEELGRDDAIGTILIALLHEITHYFQFVNGLEFSDPSLDKQAKKCARAVLNDYADTRDHP